MKFIIMNKQEESANYETDVILRITKAKKAVVL
jgi:hypothetical protein